MNMYIDFTYSTNHLKNVFSCRVSKLGRFSSLGPATAWETFLCQADAPVMHPPMEEDEDEVSGRD